MHSLIRDIYYSIFPNKSKYLVYKSGNSPIILSAPHGGGIKPTDIPYRMYGNRSGDSYTRRLIIEILNVVMTKPYYIYSDIHRSRVDLNRDIIEAAQGNKKAENIWNDWNNILGYFTSSIARKHKKGLYIDIHSHKKSNKFEIGYGISAKDYLDIRAGFETKKHSTLFPLVTENNSERNILFGTSSIIGTLERFNYDVLIPDKDENYLNGGYNIKKHSGNGIGAIQIECPIPVLKKDLDGVAQAIANGILIFQERFLGY